MFDCGFLVKFLHWASMKSSSGHGSIISTIVLLDSKHALLEIIRYAHRFKKKTLMWYLWWTYERLIFCRLYLVGLEMWLHLVIHTRVSLLCMECNLCMCSYESISMSQGQKLDDPTRNMGFSDDTHPVATNIGKLFILISFQLILWALFTFL